LALSYYERERIGAPLTDEMYFRLQKRLAVWVRTCALLEGTTPSAVARRLLHVAAEIEGFDPDGA
jgi:hypothetical protein